MINHGLRITKAYFVETGTTPDMVSHNLTTQVTQPVMNLFDERTEGGKRLTRDNLSGVAGQIIIPDANNARAVNIAGGWDSSRFRFIFEVANPNNPHGSKYYYTGYTDSATWSPMVRNFAPETRIFFNNVIEVIQTPRFGANGLEPYISVVEASHLLHPTGLGGHSNDFSTQFSSTGFGVVNQPSSLRPYDIMTTLSSNEYAKTNGLIPGQTLIDTRAGIDLCKSDRSNTVPSNYLSKTATAMLYGYQQAAHQIEQATPATAYDVAAGRSQEKPIQTDRFFSIISSEFGYQQHGFVLWGDLNKVYPELQAEGVSYVVNRKKAMESDIYLGNRHNHDSMINDRRPQTMLMAQVMQSIPGVLIENLISFARIHVTNMTPTGELIVTITDPFGLITLPPGYLVHRIPHIQQRLAQIIFGDLSFNTFIPFNMSLMVDVFGESFVEIGFNGEPPIPYSIPTYCDAMLTSIVTTNGGVLGNIANDTRYLISQTCGF